MLIAHIGRAELKYYIRREICDDLREFILRYANPDQFAEQMKDHTYEVRSIYFDTADFQFYYDKLDGLEIRKKLRLRAYNAFDPEGTAFVEIKRRRANRVIKERAPVPMSTVNTIHTRFRLPEPPPGVCTSHKCVINKYMANMISLELRPSALIYYRREAYSGRIDGTERVTIDKEVQAFIFPTLDDLFRNHDLAPVVTDRHILELKFDRFMPKWMTQLVAEFRLKCQPIPKYCMGVEQFELGEIRGNSRIARSGGE